MANFSVDSFLGQIRRLLVVRSEGRLSDAELLQRFVKCRDQDAFAALVERHGPLVQRMCQRLLRDTHTAEDAFQATFLVLARRAGSVRRPQALGCWLHGVAYRVASRARRHDPAPPLEQPEPPGREPEPFTEMTLREARARLHEALERLPEKYRLPLILCYLEEKTRDEAARQLGWAEGTFKRRLERGRELLRQQLDKHGLTISAALLTSILTAPEAHAVPAALQRATLQSAVRSAAGEALTGAASERAAQLAEAVLAATRPPRIKLVVALGLALALVGTGAGVAYQALGVRESASAAQVAVDDKPVPKAASLPDEPKRPDPPRDPLPEGAVARMGTLRFRQGGSIAALAFSPDGKRIATAGGEKQPIRLWELDGGKELQRLGTEMGRVSRVLFSSDGKFLVSAEEGPRAFRIDYKIWQWDIATRKDLNNFTLEQSASALVLSADNRYLAAADLSGTIQVWDLKTGKQLSRWEARKGSVDGLAFSPDGKHLAAGGCFFNADNRIGLWEAATGQPVRQFVGHEGGIMCCAFSPDGKMLASGGHRAGLIHLWDVATGQHLRECAGHEGVLSMVRFLDPETLLSVSYDGTVRRWAVATGKQLQRSPVRATPGLNTGIALSPDGTMLAVGNGNPAFQLWDVVSGKELPGFDGHRDGVTGVAFFDGSKGLVSTGKDGVARVWDTSSGRARQPIYPPGPAHAQALSADGRLLAAVTDKSIHAWELASGKELVQFASLEQGRHEVEVLAFSPDGKTLACSSRWGPIQLRDLATGRETIRFADYPGTIPGRFGPVPRCPFTALALAPDGRTLASAETAYLTQATQIYDTKIRLWDTVSGKELRQFDHKQGLLVIAFSADGRALLSAGHDRTVCVWETATGKLRQQCKEPKGRPSALAVSDDRRTLAWGEDSGRIVLFDLLAGREVRALQGHRGAVAALRFSADGTRLASGSDDTTILIWDVAARLPAAPVLAAASPKELEALWADLLGDDAGKAWRAMASLSRTDGAPVDFLQQHLKPEAGVDPKRMTQLLADLESTQFAARQQAEAELEKLGELAEPDLKKLLDGKPTLDTRQRVDKLLAKVSSQVWPAETLRGVRVVEVLEYLGTPEARKELERLAGGGAGARLTREAKGALQRLTAEDKRRMNADSRSR